MRQRPFALFCLIAGGLAGCATSSDRDALLQSRLAAGMTSSEIRSVLETREYQCSGSRPMTCVRAVSRLGLFQCYEKINVVLDSDSGRARQFVRPPAVCTGLGAMLAG
ncbi:hypothetical protein [Paludibacterium paludis]|uniref:Lipoprotein n=1 Tax=Paludibacterium paludis TaxID=1225769 RepID=A0A918NXW8_9NEIS|nr:hypothetical protein [Paludibacterium paludis]GGY05454.1 hypothetical protein GCM10011289_05170 [Paludibacterium paludis]